MSVQSRQAIRLIKFVAELKKNNYPNATRFTQLLRKADIDENIDCACSLRTVIRDIEILRSSTTSSIGYWAKPGRSKSSNPLPSAPKSPRRGNESSSETPNRSRPQSPNNVRN